MRYLTALGCQTWAADTLVRWQDSNYTLYEPHEYQETVASAMNINDPVSYPRIKKILPKFDIHFYRSSEEDILDTWARFMRAGANVCPQGAVAIHGVLQARQNGNIKSTDTVVAISTASAIKFTESGIRYHHSNAKYSNPYKVVSANLSELEGSLDLSSNKNAK